MVALGGDGHPVQVHEELLEHVEQRPPAQQAYGLVGVQRLPPRRLPPVPPQHAQVDLLLLRQLALIVRLVERHRRPVYLFVYKIYLFC